MLEAAVQFAVASGLRGLTLNAAQLSEGVVKRIKGAGLLLFTYGAPNKDPERIMAQKAMGVDGVIADNIGHFAKLASPQVSGGQ